MTTIYRHTGLPASRTVFLIAVTLLISSCGFLDEEARSGQPEEAVITSAAVLRQQSVLSLYDHIGGTVDGEGLQGTYRGVYDLQTFASDEAIIPVRGGDWWDGGLWVDLHLHTWAADNECCENAWVYLFQLVGLCNNSLHMLDAYGHLMSSEELSACSAEVRAVRALAYMYLTDLFGRVPIVTQLTMPLHDIVQSERSEVFAFTWNELQSAMPYLADARSNSQGEYYGRITQPVACFMLMKLALNAEIWTDDDWTDNVHPDGKSIMLDCGPDDGKKNAWEAVKLYGQKLLHSTAGYTLCESQTDCFKVYNEDAPENIFTIPMDPKIYRNRFKNLFRSLHYQHAAASGYGGENGSCATLETLKVFGYGTKDRDCRFATTFFADVVRVNGKPLILSSGDTLIYRPNEVEIDLTGSPYVATAGARMFKYSYDPGGIFDGQLRNTDIVLFRLADAYLMIAEAKVRNGEDGQSEFEIVRMREAIARSVRISPREATLEN
ncbi:MAG: RagB/SusD family nutrient uptake outer membrane protein, partial [Paludibacteraceae bacterium]|nr:RagB/SusD family nutrient uptake outer membrane protein [Paludibacteraceae bacterium]